MILLEVTPQQSDVLFAILWIAACIITIVILYYIIKVAVKNAMIEAYSEINRPLTAVTKMTDDNIPNTAQTELQKKYDMGELSFEEYKKE